MGGSDYDSESSTGSYGSASSKKKDRKDKKEKKDKGKDKDKKEKKDKDHKDKDKDGDKKDKKDKEKKDKDKEKHKDEKDKEKDKDKKKDKEKDKHKDDKHKKHDDSAQASSSYSHPGQPAPTGLISVPAFNPNYPGASARVAGHGQPNLGTGYHNPVSSSGAAPAFPSAPPSVPQPSLYPGQVPKMSYDQQPPPSGYRTPLDSHDGKPFPTDFQEVGPPVTYDLDGSPIFIGSVLFDNAVHPCKIGPHLDPPAQVAYGGVEQGHHGRYDLLPFVPEQMEWVQTSHGRIPDGRRAVEGGYEEGGEKLYHALAHVNGVKVPGKTGEHL